MTPAEMEQYVRERWEWFASFDLSDEENREDNDPEWLVQVCDATAGSPIEFYGATAAEAWGAAYAFTVEREQKITKKQEEITYMSEGRICSNPNCECAIIRRILAILEAQLADLLKGWRQP